MKCEHDQTLLELYFDGEADTTVSATVETWLDSCDPCANAFMAMGEMRAALIAPYQEKVQKADFGAMWKNIEAEIGREAEAGVPRVVVEKESVGFLESIASLFRSQPWVPAGAVALFAAVAYFGAAGPAVNPDGAAQVATVNQNAEDAESVAAAVAKSENHLAYVSGVEYESGMVILDQDLEDPTKPLIVWHIDDEDFSKGG